MDRMDRIFRMVSGLLVLLALSAAAFGEGGGALRVEIREGSTAGGLNVTHPLLPEDILAYLSCEAVVYGEPPESTPLFKVRLTGDPSASGAKWTVENGVHSYSWTYENGIRVDFAGMPDGERLRLRYTVTNGTAGPLERVLLHTCVPTTDAPAFFPGFTESTVHEPKKTGNYMGFYERTFLWSGDRPFNFAETEKGREEIHLAFTQKGMDPVRWGWWNNGPETFDLPLIAVANRDGAFTAALGFEDGVWASCNGGDDRACFHLFPHFGDLGVGESATVAGCFYLVQGTPETARTLFMRDFPEAARRDDARFYPGGRPVTGFVTHFHEGGLEELAAAPVTAELSDLIHWRMTRLDEENPDPAALQIDFSNAEQWLPMLNATGRLGFPIIDTAIHHSSIPWRQAMTARAGENLTGPDGRVWNYSSPHSPLFRETVFRYIGQFTEWFRKHDTEGRVPGYLNGAEWFYPGVLDYNPMALSAFREWLHQKYGDLENLNILWGAEYPAWDGVEPPRLGMVGGVDASLATQPFPVTAGRTYSVSAAATGRGTAAMLACLHLAWLNAEGGLLGITTVGAEETAPEQMSFRVAMRPPAGAVSAQVHCKLMGPGRLEYRAPVITGAEPGVELPGGRAGDWTHHAFIGGSAGTVSGPDGNLTLTLEAAAPPQPMKHAVLALEDWVNFSYEAMAEWLNACALEIKRNDPDRLVVSYVGFVFAQQAQWDHAMTNQRLDISLANSPAIDVNGIQMCIAGDDYTWAANVVDTARKYGKPVWSTDLIDFPYGLYSGFEPIYRGTMACIQHGMTGGFWYGWKGVPDYAFLQRMAAPDRDRLIRDTLAAHDALRGFRPHTNAAQLMPLMSFSSADGDGMKGDMVDSGGLYHLLLDSGFTPDVWTPYELERAAPDALGGYRVLFMSDCPVLPDAAHGALLRFARSGGKIISSGRLPEKNLRGLPLTPQLEGMEGVLSMGEKAGRRYWGRLRREQVYGNTPPVLVEAPDPERTPELRRSLRDRLISSVTLSGAPRPVAVGPENGDTHVTPFHNPETGGWLLFLVHKGKGRRHHADLRLDLGRQFSGAEAWCDFDARHRVAVDADGALRSPDFAHVCIIRLEG